MCKIVILRKYYDYTDLDYLFHNTLFHACIRGNILL